MKRIRNKKTSVDSSELAHICAEYLWEKQGGKIRILDVRELTDIADFFIIASANSMIHLNSLAEIVKEVFDRYDVPKYHIEGLKGTGWVLADAYDVIVHLFLDEIREYYDIESYWGDAPFEIMKDFEHETNIAN